MARILVIDDEPLVREIFGIILKRAGHEVVIAANGSEAVAIHRDQPAHLVVTDILMPEMDGLETIEELRLRSPGLKIIAISGGSKICNVDLLSLATKYGASAVLRKPVENAELVQSVVSCLGSTEVENVIPLQQSR